MKKLFLLSSLLFIGLFAGKSTAQNCAGGQSQVIVNIVPDSYPAEISWDIMDAAGNQIIAGGSVGDTVCIPTGSCAVFNIHDSYGDGIYAPGGFWLYVDGQQIATGNAFGYGTVVGISCPPGTFCSSPLPINYGSHTANFEDTWYVFNCDSSGTYQLSTCSTNTCNTAIWVYSGCTGITPQEDATGTYTFNDDFCGTQSQIITTFIGGNSYYIRIGDQMADCTSPINFSFQYVGPISGCTDPTSCNYNPLATVDDGSCIYFPNPLCQGPDLYFDSVSFVSSLQLQTVTAQACDIQEGCLLQYGDRHVIRFTSKIWNGGTLDYYLGTSASQPGMFNTNNCHGHAHYEGYGDYRLYDVNDSVIPSGHKNGYCVMDLCGFGQYNCGNMGISSNCYDVYGAGTQCQWIDITDVPTGDYRLAVIVNALHIPDAFGHHEINYTNNALQVCMHITHSPGGVPTFTLLPNCAPFVDCAGIPGGTSEVDCNGNCGGGAIAGDRQNDDLLNAGDIDVYMDDIEAGINNTAPCIDVSGNGEESVYDAELIKWCSPQTYILFPGGPPNYSCNFPRNVVNPNENTGLYIANVDFNAGYLDIAITNPSSDVTAFQFKLRGVSIASVSSLVNATSFPVDLRFNGSSNTIVGISPEDSVVHRSNAPQQLLRVYFSNITDSLICISEIVDIVNGNAERTITSVGGACWPTNFNGIVEEPNLIFFNIVPNPAKEVATIHLQNPSGKNVNAEIFDYSGKVVQTIQLNPTQLKTNINLNELSSGIYFVKVSNDSFYRVQKLVVE